MGSLGLVELLGYPSEPDTLDFLLDLDEFIAAVGDESEEVLGRRYLGYYISFIFDEHRLSEREWRMRRRPFSFFSRPVLPVRCRLPF